MLLHINIWAFPGDSAIKSLLWVGRISWRRKWQPTPVFLPGESHGKRSLAGYSPWGHRVRHALATKPPPHININVYTLM